MRLRYVFAEGDDSPEIIEGDFNPKLYVKSKWQPPIADENMESRLENFETALEDARAEIKSQTKPSTNITPAVEKILSSIMSDKSRIVLATDKNLGPAITSKVCSPNIFWTGRHIDN